MTEQPSTSVSSNEIAVHKEKRVWYYSTLFNAFIIGGVGFMAPGLWNAMNSLGAGGAQSPFLINAANALVFGLMGFLCLFGGPVANRIGLNWTLLLGAVGAALYTNNRYGNVWFVLLGSVACGLSAGLFWASEGAVALGYPEPTKRGRYMNIWLWFRTGGPLLGGAIVLGLNQLVASWELKIHTAVAYQSIVLLKQGTKERLTRRLISSSSHYNVFPFLWRYFSRRLKRSNVVMAANQGNFARLLSSGMISRFLDYRGISIKNRLVYSFYYVVIVHIAAWVYAWVIQEKYTANPPSYDWSDKGFTEGLFVILLWEFSQQALQNFLYYLVSTMTDNISELARYSGILRGQESFAQAISFGLNTRNWHGGRVPLAVNTILLGLAVLPTWLVVKDHVPAEHDAQAPGVRDEEKGAVEHVIGARDKGLVRGTIEAK
ncbi:hypothetical protein BBP40_012601 [Aspergillus hancockii]|nr:hypothetical protein BBP40_012601 [Aspergillus hancockii]